MPHDIDDYPVVIMVPASATIPAENVTASEWMDVKTRLAAEENKALGDLTNVDTTGAAAGMVLQFDGTEWEAVARPAGTVGKVGQNYGDPQPNVHDVSYITFGPGLSVEDRGSGRVHIAPVTGTAANTLAAGPHTHTQPLPVTISTAPSGYLSGGSRPLGTSSVTLTNGIAYVVEAELFGQLRGADAGAAYYTLTITIDGMTTSSPSGADGLWCVQGVPDKIKWEASRKITGTGASISVTAAVLWTSGAGLNVDRTWLRVRLRPER